MASIRAYSEGDRCEVCAYYYWDDGHWHSLVPILFADTPDEVHLVMCPLCFRKKPSYKAKLQFEII
jgi:hypothetical protein